MRYVKKGLSSEYFMNRIYYMKVSAFVSAH